MKRLVLDCSIAAAWAFEDEHDALAITILQDIDDIEAIAPNIWPLELANVLALAERRGRISRKEANQFLRQIREFAITVDQNTTAHAFGRILGLARRHKITTYDAAYLELALRSGIALATTDRGLRSAATRAKAKIYG